MSSPYDFRSHAIAPYFLSTARRRPRYRYRRRPPCPPRSTAAVPARPALAAPLVLQRPAVRPGVDDGRAKKLAAHVSWITWQAGRAILHGEPVSLRQLTSAPDAAWSA